MDKIKIWAFPLLTALVGWFIVDTLGQIRDDIQSVRADVKMLLAQSNIDKTRIDNLERELYEGKVADTEPENLPETPAKNPSLIVDMFIPVKQDELYELIEELA